MRKIFLVTEGEYDDYHIVAAFSTRAGAERYLNGEQRHALFKQHPNAVGMNLRGGWLWNSETQHDIEEYEIDQQLEPIHWVARPRKTKDLDVVLVVPEFLQT